MTTGLFPWNALHPKSPQFRIKGSFNASLGKVTRPLRVAPHFIMRTSRHRPITTGDPHDEWGGPHRAA
jgi:hypothetical protein